MSSRDLAKKTNLILMFVLILLGMLIGYAANKQMVSASIDADQITLESLVLPPSPETPISTQPIVRDPVRLGDAAQKMSVGKKLRFLRDAQKSLTINDVHRKMQNHWIKSDVDIPSFGFSDAAYWFYFDVENVSERDREWLLELPYPVIDQLNLYYFSDAGDARLYRVGSLKPFNERPIKHRNFVFPLVFNAHEKARVYFRVESDSSIQMPLTLWTERQFLESDQVYLIAQGFYFGAMLIMALYNFFVYLIVRDRSYLFYVLYVSSFSLYQLTTQGLGFQYVWPEAVQWNAVATPVLAALSVTCASLFVMDFLSLRKNAIAFYRVMLGATLVASLSVLAAYFAPHKNMMEFIAILAGGVAAVAMSSGIILWREGRVTARYFTVAYICLFVGVLLLILNKFGIVPRNVITEKGAQIGALMEVFLLSLALAERINRERRKRFLAQKKALDEMAEKEKAERKLVYQSLHDSLIGCANREMLKLRLETLITEEPNRPLGILLVQLARYHEINNTLGHHNGDEILKRIARRLAEMAYDVEGLVLIDEEDTESGGFALVEGVSFGVVINLDTQSKEYRIQMATEKLLESLVRPFEFKGMALEISAKIGVSVYPDHGDDVHELLQHAHVAVEVARKSNEVMAVYSSDVDPYSARRLVLVGELRNAINNDELQLFFQPQLDLRTNAVVGAEALLRWVHPVHGFVPPDEFVLIAEKTGLIKPLTGWVLDNAIKQTAYFLEKGYRIKISVNLSAKNLQESDLVQKMMMLLDRYKVPPTLLVLEITETAMMLDPQQALKTLNEISECGIGLSIDDFGTGYSSLAYLKQLPVDEIKIDRSFVMEMSAGSDDEFIVNTTLNMSHNLGLKVVAEGVENIEVLNSLKAMGCDLAQGYFFSKPIRVDAFEEWLTECEYAVGSVIEISHTGSRA